MTRILIAAALVLGGQSVLAQAPLLTPLDGARTAQHAARLSQLRGSVHVVEAELVAADVSALDAVEVSIRLLGSDHTFTRRSVRQRAADDWTWTGTHGHDLAVLVVRDGRVTGTVWAGGKRYQIHPAGGTVHAVSQMDPSAGRLYEDDAVVVDRDSERPRPEPNVGTAQSDGGVTVIDLIAPYTSEMVEAYLDPVAAIQVGVDLANAMFVNSDIPVEIALVYTYETPTAASSGNDLRALQDSDDGRFDEVHDLRDAYGADLVVLFAGNGSDYGYGGRGFLDVTEAWAFSLVATNAARFSTLAHEIGHNAGSSHDAYQNNNSERSPPYDYGQGAVNTAGRWRTVMAYNIECADAGFYCERIPYWSSPHVTYDDTTAPESDGPTGDVSTADNARLWRERAATLAGFRDRPSAPASLSASLGSVSIDLPLGGTATRSLTISNEAPAGAYPLAWRAKTQEWVDGAPPCDPARPFSLGYTGGASYGRVMSAGSVERGQSYTAPCTGLLRSLTLPVLNAGPPHSPTWSATLRLFAGEGTGGAEVAAVSAAFTAPSENQSTYWAPFEMSPPVAITADETYTWFVDMTEGAAVYYHSEDVYEGGTAYGGPSPAAAAAIPDMDLWFDLDYEEPVDWYALSTHAGSVFPGGSATVDITVDASGLAPGTYTLDLVLITNDPDAPETTIPITVTVGGATDTEVAAATSTWLAPPVPNPSRGGATVTYRLSAPGHARMTVVDLLGREVDVLVDGFHHAGLAQTTLPAGLAPGLYVIRLVSGREQVAHRFTVVR